MQNKLVEQLINIKLDESTNPWLSKANSLGTLDTELGKLRPSDGILGSLFYVLKYGEYAFGEEETAKVYADALAKARKEKWGVTKINGSYRATLLDKDTIKEIDAVEDACDLITGRSFAPTKTTTNVSAALKVLATYSKHKQISDLIRVGEEFLKGK